MGCLFEPLYPVSLYRASACIELFEKLLKVDILLSHFLNLNHGSSLRTWRSHADVGSTCGILLICSISCCLSLQHHLFLLFFQNILLHVCLKEANRINLSDELNLLFELIILQFVSLNRLLNKWNVRGKVKGQFLCNV